MDRYLAGWCALLLSPAGRLVLINAVLDVLPSYAMGALKLPRKVVTALDSLRWAFLWNAADRASGAQCLVAWDRVCRAKAEGGLGVHDLASQNDLLLLKVLHRLHTLPCSRWASWVWASLGECLLLDAHGSTLAGEHCTHLRSLVPLYRSLSRVVIGDGRTTAFWEDHWLPCGPLRCAFPALASHTFTEVSVWAVRTLGLDAVLVPRLSVATSRERLLLLPPIERGGTGAGATDHRSLVLCAKPKGQLTSSGVYSLLRLGGEVAENAAFLWSSPAPSRVRFFSWLLTLKRIHTRDNLLKKHIVEPCNAGCPDCGSALETPDHLIFGCPFAQAFWSALHLSTTGATVRALHHFDVSGAVGAASPHAFALLCC